MVYNPKITDENFDLSETKLKTIDFIDNCKFAKYYNENTNRSDIFLNLKDKLFSAIKTNVFYYSFKRNIINKLSSNLSFDHTGGSFVFLPLSSQIYCISGISTNTCEYIKLPIKEENLQMEVWTQGPLLSKSRAYFSTFVQNESIIYLIFGYDYIDASNILNLEKLDTNDSSPEWSIFKLNNTEKIPILTFFASLPATEDQILIIGGKDEYNQDNNIIYSICLRNLTIEDTFLRLPVQDLENESSNDIVFYQENYFLPIEFSTKNINQILVMALFDSKDFLHIINLKNFNYAFIHEEDDVPEEEYNEEIENIVKIDEDNVDYGLIKLSLGSEEGRR